MDSRVASLALHVRAGSDGTGDVGEGAERFTRHVLARCDELLEQRAPGRVLLMRQLDLSLRLAGRAFTDEAEIDACARLLADAIGEAAWSANAAEGRGPGSGDLEVAAFASDAEWRGAYVEAAARGGSSAAWYFEPLQAEVGSAVAFLTSASPELLLSVLAQLRRRGTLAPTVAALPRTVIDGLAARLGCGKQRRDIPHSPMSSSILQLMHQLGPGVDIPEAWIHLAVETYLEDGSVSSEMRPHPAVEAAIEAYRKYSDATAAEDSDAPPGGAIECAHGGVFYLLPLVMELGVGEALWRACIPEGLVLSQVVSSLIGPDARDSPAPRAFSGVDHVTTSVPLAPEQREEIAGALLTAFIDAVPRRGLSAWPEVDVRLANVDAGRLLLACERRTAQPVFAAPAKAADETVSALEMFLSGWPASAPKPRAERGLMAIDRSARLRPRVRATGVDPFVVDGQALDESALITQIAGTLAYLFLARLGIEDGADSLTTLRAVLATPARLLFGRDTLVVRIPMELLDVRVRRAGLDTDPGWIPWLDRRVTFEYFEQS